MRLLGNGNCNGKRRSRFPEGMTERKARAKAECMDLSTALRSGRDDAVVGRVVDGRKAGRYGYQV